MKQMNESCSDIECCESCCYSSFLSDISSSSESCKLGCLHEPNCSELSDEDQQLLCQMGSSFINCETFSFENSSFCCSSSGILFNEVCPETEYEIDGASDTETGSDGKKESTLKDFLTRVVGNPWAIAILCSLTTTFLFLGFIHFKKYKKEQSEKLYSIQNYWDLHVEPKRKQKKIIKNKVKDKKDLHEVKLKVKPGTVAKPNSTPASIILPDATHNITFNQHNHTVFPILSIYLRASKYSR
eukprot:snap_masked-scaffold_10-processed-gene-1.46-mRNA-1 protein AED:0.07 eAED:1.00 QI:0/0/0/1/1/1/2/0/241